MRIGLCGIDWHPVIAIVAIKIEPGIQISAVQTIRFVVE